VANDPCVESLGLGTSTRNPPVACDLDLFLRESAFVSSRVHNLQLFDGGSLGVFNIHALKHHRSPDMHGCW